MSIMNTKHFTIIALLLFVVTIGAKAQSGSDSAKAK